MGGAQQQQVAQQKQQNVMSVENTEIYQPQQQPVNNIAYSQPAQVMQVSPSPEQYSTYDPMATNQAPEYQQSQDSLDYASLTQNRARTSRLSNVDQISNNYAPTSQPENIIAQNAGFISSNNKPQSDIYKDTKYAGLPTPRSMAEQYETRAPQYSSVQQQQVNTYRVQQPMAQVAPQVRTQQVAYQKPASQINPSKRILKYSEMPNQKRVSWDGNLEKWLIASGKLSQFTPKEKQVWEKQRAILQSVYQEEFKPAVERTKRRIVAQQRSSLKMFGDRGFQTDKIIQDLNKDQLSEALQTSFLRRASI